MIPFIGPAMSILARVRRDDLFDELGQAIARKHRPGNDGERPSDTQARIDDLRRQLRAIAAPTVPGDVPRWDEEDAGAAIGSDAALHDALLRAKWWPDPDDRCPYDDWRPARDVA